MAMFTRHQHAAMDIVDMCQRHHRRMNGIIQGQIVHGVRLHVNHLIEGMIQKEVRKLS